MGMRNRGEGDRGGGVRRHLYYGVFVVVTCVASLHFISLQEDWRGISHSFQKRRRSQSNPPIAVILLRFKTIAIGKDAIESL